VEITKADTTTQNANITITVTNVNEGSAVGISDQTREIAENSANATNVGAVLTTTGSPTGFSITSGNTGSAFAISNSGQITVLDTGELDFETTPIYTLVVDITKADTTSDSATITINLTNVTVMAAFTMTTTVPTWYAGGEEENLAKIVDGDKSTDGTGDYQVHPQNADGETITFNLDGNYTGGSFIFYNRSNSCCSERILNSTVDFIIDGAPVEQSTILSSANIITISAPNSSYDKVILTFSGEGQNFREIEIVSDP
jgi:hypothetical protein